MLKLFMLTVIVVGSLMLLGFAGAAAMTSPIGQIALAVLFLLSMSFGVILAAHTVSPNFRQTKKSAHS
ncbi:MAG: hypothetical protein ABL973_09775 [Micropepsaceae bacterium]